MPSESISAGAFDIPAERRLPGPGTAADLEAKGVSHTDAVNNDGLVSWTIKDGKGSIDWNDGFGACGETFAMDGSVVSYTMDGTGDCSTAETYEFRWTLAGDELTVTFVTGRLSGVEDASISTFGKAFLERTWKKIDRSLAAMEASAVDLPAQHRVHRPATWRCRCSSTWPYVLEVSVMELCPRRFLTSASVMPCASRNVAAGVPQIMEAAGRQTRTNKGGRERPRDGRRVVRRAVQGGEHVSAVDPAGA